VRHNISVSSNNKHCKPDGPGFGTKPYSIRHKMCSFASIMSKRENVVPMCVINPSGGTDAGRLYVELCVPNVNHRAYSEYA
jgi:hypothetical protein